MRTIFSMRVFIAVCATAAVLSLCACNKSGSGGSSAPLDDFSAQPPASQGSVYGISLSTAKTGKLVIPAMFEDAQPFSEGLAAAKSAGLWGYVNKNGQWAIEPKFAAAQPFSEGLAVVHLDDREGNTAAINDKGAVILTLGFPVLYEFSQGLAAFQTASQRWGYMNSKGEIVVYPKLSFAGNFEADGLAVVRLGEGENDNWGLLDRRGNFVVTPTQAKIGAAGESLRYVRDGVGRAGFIDTHGKRVLGGRWEDAHHFSHGLCPVMVDGKWGAIDRAGTLIVAAEFEDLEPFSQGRAASRQTVDGKHLWGFVDTHGRVLVEPKFADDLPPGPYEEGVARVAAMTQSGPQAGYVGLDGDYVIAPQFPLKAPKLPQNFTQELAAVPMQMGEQLLWGYIGR